MHCKICDSATADFGQLRILSSFDARYRRCTQCGFVFVESAEWLQQAYSSAIAASDTGIVTRNLKLAQIVGLLIALEFPAARRFLDYGGGSGLLVRLMRDQGFDFYLLDKYCANVLAAGFEAKPSERFDLLTCMEVAEHLVDPVPTFLELGALAPSIVIGTELLPATANRPGEWWYYAPETGQHIASIPWPRSRSLQSGCSFIWQPTDSICTSCRRRRSAADCCASSPHAGDGRAHALWSG